MRISNEAAVLARKQHGLVARRQLVALGVPAGSVSKHAQHAGWRPVHRGVYELPGALPGYERDVVAALLALGDQALASHLTAAYLHGVLSAPPVLVDVLLPYRSRSRQLDGVHVTRSRTLRASDRCVIGSIPATTLPRTMIDAATVLEPPGIRALLIDARKRRRLDLGRVARRLLGVGPVRNSGALRQILYELDPVRVDSVFEDEVRKLLRRRGVRAPHPGPFKVRAGDRVVEIDIAWPDLRVGIEVDGHGYHSEREHLDKDHRKQNALLVEGWLILRVSWDRLLRDPDGFVAEVEELLAAAMWAVRRL